MAKGLRSVAELDIGTRAEFSEVYVLNGHTKLSPHSSRFTFSRANGSGRCTLSLPPGIPTFLRAPHPGVYPFVHTAASYTPGPLAFLSPGWTPPTPSYRLLSADAWPGGDPAATGPSTGGSPIIPLHLEGTAMCMHLPSEISWGPPSSSSK